MSETLTVDQQRLTQLLETLRLTLLRQRELEKVLEIQRELLKEVDQHLSGHPIYSIKDLSKKIKRSLENT